MTLQVGEVVRLKSGGPAMTVVATGARAEPGVVECAWFDRDSAYATASFPPRALERVNLEHPAPHAPVALTRAGFPTP
ncbi:MAG: putative small protein [Caulobacteraceae bacterium]|nr:putative small protein [Caulobacteraceae bacterium]